MDFLKTYLFERDGTPKDHNIDYVFGLHLAYCDSIVLLPSSILNDTEQIKTILKIHFKFLKFFNCFDHISSVK